MKSSQRIGKNGSYSDYLGGLAIARRALARRLCETYAFRWSWAFG